MVNISDAIKGAVVAISSILVVIITKRDYARIAAATPIAVDAYVGEPKPALMDQLHCVLIHWYTRLTRTMHSEADPYQIVSYKDPYVDGLYRTRAAKPNEEPTKSRKPKSPLVIGTIRKCSVCLPPLTSNRRTKVLYQCKTLIHFFY